MEYRLLGRTGLKVSPLCLGALTFGTKEFPIGGGTPPEEAHRMVARALDAGINFVDTANVYSRGISEEITGEALKRLGQRDRVTWRPRCTARWQMTTPTCRALHVAT